MGKNPNKDQKAKNKVSNLISKYLTLEKQHQNYQENNNPRLPTIGKARTTPSAVPNERQEQQVAKTTTNNKGENEKQQTKTTIEVQTTSNKSTKGMETTTKTPSGTQIEQQKHKLG